MGVTWRRLWPGRKWRYSQAAAGAVPVRVRLSRPTLAPDRPACLSPDPICASDTSGACPHPTPSRVLLVAGRSAAQLARARESCLHGATALHAAGLAMRTRRVQRALAVGGGRGGFAPGRTGDGSGWAESGGHRRW